MSYISYFCFTLQTSEALLISYFSTFYFYFSTLQFYFSTLQILFFYIENPNPKFLNLRLNASSSMGTHCQVSSQLIKKNPHFFSIVPFLPQGSLEPGSLDSEASSLPLSYLAVDIRLSIVGLYICSISQYIPI